MLRTYKMEMWFNQWWNADVPDGFRPQADILESPWWIAFSQYSDHEKMEILLMVTCLRKGSTNPPLRDIPRHNPANQSGPQS